MKVLVSAVGGGVGQSIMKALQDTKYEVVAVDSSIDAMGLYNVKSSHLVRHCTDSGYIDNLIEICKKEDCKFIFPGLDAELEILSNNRKKFIEYGIIPIVSDERVVKLSDDKFALYEFLKKNGFPYPETEKYSSNSNIKFPVVLKPMIGGCRSQNVSIIGDYGSLVNSYGKKGGNYIIQEYIDGDEYTCGSVSFAGVTHGVIVMRRELRDGDTYKAYVVRDKNLEEFLEKLLKKIQPFGPCNIQLRVRNNVPYVFEINARCSGTTAARALAGFNEPEMICDFLTIGETKYNIKEVAILRYWNEHVVEYGEMEKMKHEGYINRS